MRIVQLIFLGALIFPSLVFAIEYKPNLLDSTYDHDYWGTESKGILKNFTAYTADFDDADDDNNDGIPDIWGEPHWVSYQIKKTSSPCIKTHPRPSTWISDEELLDQGLMSEDRSYAYSAAFLKNRKDWFSRGHLAMKMHAERLGEAAGWNTHTFYNAVPQRQLFNAGIWQDLEDHTAAWAQQYGEVWVITGPIFADMSPVSYLGEEGEMPVAIPDALFKIVIKNNSETNTPDVLAFIYPQVGPSYYHGKPYDHTRFTTTVDEIEKVTGIDFLTRVPLATQKKIESRENRRLWDIKKEDFIRACSSRYNE